MIFNKVDPILVQFLAPKQSSNTNDKVESQTIDTAHTSISTRQ